MKKKPIILCVDDEKFILDTLDAQLQERFGDEYDFEFAERAEEAIALIGKLGTEGYTVVMVISDQRMPGMSGDEFLTHVHQEHPMPIKILLTGQASLESAVNAINNANLYRYISKPWDQEDFLLTVEKGLEQYDLMLKNTRQIKVFKQFVPEQFIESLGVVSALDIKLGDHVQRKMCVYFSDIRGFTNLAERMTPEQSYRFINDYLECIEPAIVKNNGFIDKFIGDAVMALFHNESDAVKAAIDTQVALKRMNDERSKLAVASAHPAPPQIRSGIGLHTGELMLGIIGVSSRMQCTVISDAVNLASRLQDLAALFGLGIVVSDAVRNAIHADNLCVHSRFLGRATLRGKVQPLTIYEIIDEEADENASLKIKTRDDLEKGIGLFLEQQFADACVLFKRVTTAFPDDKIANLYLRRSAHYMVNGPDKGWIGAELTTRVSHSSADAQQAPIR